MNFRVLRGRSPCPASIAPYWEICLADANAEANSAYRGQDAAALLHRLGKKTQAELFATLPPGYANPPGRSTHELRSDGVAFPGPVGRRLDEWQIGVDVNDDRVRAVKAAAAKHGWTVFQPYASGIEFHHLCFRYRPRPYGVRMRARLVALRARLPRR